MDQVLNIYKEAGETPLECIERFRKTRPELAGRSLSYAGRLDPMAEGVLLVLVDANANRNRETYLLYTKQYYFEMVFGFATDTYDLLGLVKEGETSHLSGVTKERVLEEIVSMKGKTMQTYRPFSSRTVKGKPLFQWAREGRLDEIEIPKNEIELYSIELVNSTKWSGTELGAFVVDRVRKVKGDFRQAEIETQWQRSLKDKTSQFFPVFGMRITCSSGTYVRAIVNTLGQKMATGAVTLRIVREKVGEHHISQSLRV